MEHNKLPWKRCAVAGGWDGIKSDDGTILFNVSANNLANSDLLIKAVNEYDTLKAKAELFDKTVASLECVMTPIEGRTLLEETIGMAVTAQEFLNKAKELK